MQPGCLPESQLLVADSQNGALRGNLLDFLRTLLKRELPKMPVVGRGATPAAAFPSYPVEDFTKGEGETMLWTIFAILLILWLLGFSFHVAGGLIHLLLVAAVIVLIVNLITGRRTVV
jgi:hypothetical protein